MLPASEAKTTRDGANNGPQAREYHIREVQAAAAGHPDKKRQERSGAEADASASTRIDISSVMIWKRLRETAARAPSGLVAQLVRAIGS